MRRRVCLIFLGLAFSCFVVLGTIITVRMLSSGTAGVTEVEASASAPAPSPSASGTPKEHMSVQGEETSDQHQTEKVGEDEKTKGELNKDPEVQPPDINQHEPINLIFAGDALMDWSVKETIRKKGPDYPFQFVKSEVKQADYAFVNLETAVTNHNEKDTVQIYNFKSDPASLQGIKGAGFDVVSIANNHVLDYKQKGFLDTLKHLQETGLPYVGGGMNKQEAYRAHTAKIKGKTVKFLAFSRFIPDSSWFAKEDSSGIAEAYTKKNVFTAISNERKDADYLIIYMHWGIEKNHKPEQWQREFAKEMIDLGADAIVGSHVHVLQGFEFYKGKPVAYSIGNFLFPDYVRGAKADTGLLKMQLDNGDIRIEFEPYYIYKDQIIKKDSTYDKKQLKFLESISYGVKAVDRQFVEAKKVNKE